MLGTFVWLETTSFDYLIWPYFNSSWQCNFFLFNSSEPDPWSWCDFELYVGQFFSSQHSLPIHILNTSTIHKPVHTVFILMSFNQRLVRSYWVKIPACVVRSFFLSKKKQQRWPRSVRTTTATSNPRTNNNWMQNQQTIFTVTLPTLLPSHHFLFVMNTICLTLST